MHPLLLERVAQEQIEALRREAAVQRLAQRPHRVKKSRRRAVAPRLEEAPVH